MELTAGTRLGPYEIVRSIGAGGMGVVYRAKDTRLDRSVAIKVLPESLRGNADRLRRFEQEARTVGGLNHPNLVTLHDVGRHEDVPYLVTELLEGQSLRAKLADGPLALRDAVKIAIEIARGLAAAHGANIVHRDIKPDNVYVTNDGRVKILDFGIAKLQRDTPDDLGSADTLGGTAGTGTGVVIGTPGYMAPEQLASGDIDARTDVFALGVVLYEMLARKRPFAAESGIEESYAIVKQPPGALPDSVPPALARIVTRCLEKRREARFQSAADLAFALESFETAPTTAPTVPVKAVEPPAVTTEEVKPSRRRSVPILPLAALGAVTALGIAYFYRPKAMKPVVLASPPAAAATHWPDLVQGGPKYRRITYQNEPKWFARFSPDGKSVFFSKRNGHDYDVMRTDLDQSNMVQVAGAKGRVLDISGKGELALRQRLPDEPGGLLVTFIEGKGAARVRERNVHDASYTGDELAVVRDTGSAAVLEYPAGKEIATFPNIKLDHLRASPDGTLLATGEYPIATDSRGYVVVYDLTGKERARSKPHMNIDGVAWSVNGKEVWFSGEDGMYAMTLDGQERTLLYTPGDVFLRDVRHDDSNRILLAPRTFRVHAFSHHAGKDNDDNIGWRTAMITSISRDGSALALLDGSGVDETEQGYALYVRKGSDDPVLLEHGYDIALSSDGSFAAVLAGHDKLRVVPTGAGTPYELPIAPVETFDYSAKLEVSADNKHVLALAREKGKPMRLWSFAIDGKSPPVAVGPDKIEPAIDDDRERWRFAVSPDDKWIGVANDKGVKLVAMSGTDSLVIPGEHGESPIAFAEDGKSVFVWRTHGWPRPITRVELAPPYKRTELLPFAPPDKPQHVDVVVAASGSTIAYGWVEIASDLFVLEPH